MPRIIPVWTGAALMGALLTGAPGGTWVTPTHADEFADTWYDGRAELSGYELTVSRYGENRRGEAVLITVTEPFDTAQMVKADRPTDDTVNVIKLNLVRDFQTGIYDYNTMVSLFLHDATLDFLKVSFSSAEWCGHVYEELVRTDGGLNRTVHSYFQGESVRSDLPLAENGILEDQLFLLLRGLRGGFLSPGESWTGPFLPGPYFSRLAHAEPAWTRVTVRRGNDAEPLTVPAGEFVSHRYTVNVESGREGVFWIEDAYPHRILRWRLPPDLEASLTGSERLPYWQLNGNDDERYLKEIGLR